MDPNLTQFWQALDKLVAGARIVIDRPKGSRHPRYPAIVYPLDYGYLEGTTAVDGGGVDVWRGSLPEPALAGALCTVDLVKRDVEVKLLLGCTPDEIATARDFCREGPYMKCALLAR